MTTKILNSLSSVKVSFRCTGKTKTQQSFKKDCDINVLYKKFQSGGMVDPEVFSRKPGRYADLSEVVDFQTAQQYLIDAGHEFDRLPLDVRRKFGFNVAEFLDFVGDPKNGEELVRLGLAEYRKDPPPDYQQQTAEGIEKLAKILTDKETNKKTAQLDT